MFGIPSFARWPSLQSLRPSSWVFQDPELRPEQDNFGREPQHWPDDSPLHEEDIPGDLQSPADSSAQGGQGYPGYQGLPDSNGWFGDGVVNPLDLRHVPVDPRSVEANLWLYVPPGQDYQQCLRAIPEYNPDTFNAPGMVEYNNCNAYAFNDPRSNRTKKPQPGELAGLPPLDPSEYTCRNLRERIALDHPGVIFTQDIKDPCPCGYYRVFLGLDRENPNPDYHFWRQDRVGTWSHKPGARNATQNDDRGRPITIDPRTADRNYENDDGTGYNYNTDCGFICVPGGSRLPYPH